MSDSTTLLVIIIVIIVIIAIYYFFSTQNDINKLKNQLATCSKGIQPFSSEKPYVSNNLETNKPVNNVNLHANNVNLMSNRIGNQKPIVPISNPINPIPIPIPIDIHEYDVNNLENPFVKPTARPPGYIFGPMMSNPSFYNPTRGYPDKAAYIANLVKINASDKKKLLGNGDDRNRKFDEFYNGHLLFAEQEYKNKHHHHHSDPQTPTVLQLMGYQKYPGSSKFEYYVLLPSTGNNPSIKYPIETHKNEELYDGDIVRVLNQEYVVQKNKSPFEYFAV